MAGIMNKLMTQLRSRCSCRVRWRGCTFYADEVKFPPENVNIDRIILQPPLLVQVRLTPHSILTLADILPYSTTRSPRTQRVFVRGYEHAVKAPPRTVERLETVSQPFWSAK
jgi:hypothetical protein